MEYVCSSKFTQLHFHSWSYSTTPICSNINEWINKCIDTLATFHPPYTSSTNIWEWEEARIRNHFLALMHGMRNLAAPPLILCVLCNRHALCYSWLFTQLWGFNVNVSMDVFNQKLLANHYWAFVSGFLQDWALRQKRRGYQGWIRTIPWNNYIYIFS